ncbi:MAG: tRNA pseudouridine(13) synthase TruD [Candidatus Sedimenticola sp. (ex Thyasira tokunagai)]
MDDSCQPDLLMPKLPYAFGGPCGSGLIRLQPEDFLVDEITVVESDGEGEHLLLQIEKRNSNTEWVAGQLARHADVPRRDVSYAGQKDRHAVTRQWFSVRLAGKPEPDWRLLETTDLKILQTARHGKKLRIGVLKGNRFVIKVREYRGDVAALETCLTRLAKKGMPNYYGEQRFGREGNNLASAAALFRGELKRLKRQKRGIYLSAARSLLFNRVVAARVAAGTWDTPLVGERMILAGSQSSFLASEIDEDILRRCRTMDIHTSAPLWGKGDVMTSGVVAELEAQELAADGLFREGLERFGLKMERRAMRAAVNDLQWDIKGDQLILQFSLSKGSFATSLLRECIDYRLP